MASTKYMDVRMHRHDGDNTPSAEDAEGGKNSEWCYKHTHETGNYVKFIMHEPTDYIIIFFHGI